MCSRPGEDLGYNSLTVCRNPPGRVPEASLGFSRLQYSFARDVCTFKSSVSLCSCF